MIRSFYFGSGPLIIRFPVKKRHLQNRKKDVRDDEKRCIFKCLSSIYKNDEKDYNASCQDFNNNGEQIQLGE